MLAIGKSGGYSPGMKIYEVGFNSENILVWNLKQNLSSSGFKSDFYENWLVVGNEGSSNTVLYKLSDQTGQYEAQLTKDSQDIGSSVSISSSTFFASSTVGANAQ